MRRVLIVALALGLPFVGGRLAKGNPRPLPFTYTSETLPPGAYEIEQFGDLIPVRVLSGTTGGQVEYLSLELQTEFEVGLTDHLELGLYFTVVPRLGDSYVEYPVPVEGNGLKQRLRYQFADPGEWPVDVGVYSEITENERLFELEEKILLAKRFGPVRVAANLVAEIEFYYAGAAAMSGTTTTTTSARDLELDPSIGATWEVTPKLHLGVETWMHVEFPDPVPATRGFNLGPLVYAGPVVMFDFGRIWWSTGIYGRVTDIDHTAVPGDQYGPVWIRTIVGFGL